MIDLLVNALLVGGVFLVVNGNVTAKKKKRQQLLPDLAGYVEALPAEFAMIDGERKEALAQIADFVRQKIYVGKPADLVFICTHNSRRSHMAQLWAQAAAYYYGVEPVRTFSGGTEATAFNPRAVQAMQNAGFAIQAADPGKNPLYQVRFAAAAPALQAFSKKYDAEPNPESDFCAVMTCSQADAACPFVPGCALRVALPYDDPKDFDGTAQESVQYAERARQIAREMFYLFALLKEK